MGVNVPIGIFSFNFIGGLQKGISNAARGWCREKNWFERWQKKERRRPTSQPVLFYNEYRIHQWKLITTTAVLALVYWQYLYRRWAVETNVDNTITQTTVNIAATHRLYHTTHSIRTPSIPPPPPSSITYNELCVFLLFTAWEKKKQS